MNGQVRIYVLQMLMPRAGFTLWTSLHSKCSYSLGIDVGHTYVFLLVISMGRRLPWDPKREETLTLEAEKYLESIWEGYIWKMCPVVTTGEMPRCSQRTTPFSSVCMSCVVQHLLSASVCPLCAKPLGNRVRFTPDPVFVLSRESWWEGK